MWITACGGEGPADTQALLPAARLERNEEAKPDVATLALSSSIIVVGVVESLESIGTPDSLDDPDPSEYFILTVALKNVVKVPADAPASVSFIWEGFVTSDGERIAAVVQQGVPLPRVDDQLLLFLNPMRTDQAEFLSLQGVYDVNTLDGILWISDGVLVSPLEGDNRPSDRLDGRTLDLVLEELKGLSGGTS